MRLRDGLGALPPRTVWRFFPLFVALAMSVVIAVNAGMIYAALHTFPGNAGSDGFDLSNHYDRVLDRVARQAAMGWRLTADANASGLPSIVLTDRDGAPLTGARFDAVATRPVGAQMTTQMPFTRSHPAVTLAPSRCQYWVNGSCGSP